jgi:nitrogen fixation/metabolism regulation signal transduction histidine kinase
LDDVPIVELRVKDNGKGIPDPLLNTLYEPHTTTKSKGGGLGLAVVKRIVEEHSGSTFAENNPDGGASIVVRLPLVSAHRGHLPGRLAQVT